MDPAWGTTSLSDEDTARALCAFQHTEPLPTQQRHPLPSRRQQPEMPQLAPSGDRAAFGYPANGVYHMVPMSSHHEDEAASVLMEMHSPAASSADWQTQQKRAIQEQVEQQQRELETQTQQREMQTQLQQLQAQIMQQEQAHRQQEQLQVQRQQQQAQRHLERIQQPQVSSEASGFDQARWAYGAHVPRAATSNVSSFSESGGSQHRTAAQQPRQFYERGFQRQVPMRPRSSTPIYARGLPAGVSTSRGGGMFASQQVPQLAQTHFQAQNPEKYDPSALHSWEMGESLPLSDMQARNTNTGMMQRFGSQQPRPYQSAQVQQRGEPRASIRMHTGRPGSEDVFLNEIMRHFPMSGGSSMAGAPTTAASNPLTGISSSNSFMFTPAPTQSHPRLAEYQRRMDTHSRVTVPPTGISVVPGVSLASLPTRLLTMRDILNVDEVMSKTTPLRGQPRGGKQQRAPSKRKTQKGKYQRMTKQRSEQQSQPPSKRPSNILANHSASLGPSRTSTLIAKPCTPMYLAFMESRAARALQEAVGMASSAPTTQPQPSAPSSTNAITAATNHATSSGLSVPDKQKRASYKRKRVDAAQGVHDFPITTQSEQQSVFATAPEHSARTREVYTNVQKPSISQANTTERAPKDEERVLANDRMSSASANAVNGVQRHQVSNVNHSDRLQNKVEGCEAEKLDRSTQRGRRATLPQAVPNHLTKRVVGQEVVDALSASSIGLTVRGSDSAIATTPPVVAQAHAVSNLPRAENRTVVIFCKRDFMRYQAARIWRKYQDQLKRQEEWREVRVAGKRTRYLNSRYDDELQKQHNKSYKRSTRPRKKTLQKVQASRDHVATSSATHIDPVESTEALSKVANNGDGDSAPSKTPDAASPDAGSLSKPNGVVLNANGKAESSPPVTVQYAVKKNQEQQLLTDASDKGKAQSAVFNSPDGPAKEATDIPADLQAHTGVVNAVPAENMKGIANATPQVDSVAVVGTATCNAELTVEAPEGNTPASSVARDRPLAVSRESPDGIGSSLFVEKSVKDPISEIDIVVTGANESCVDNIGNASVPNDVAGSDTNVIASTSATVPESSGEVVNTCVSESTSEAAKTIDTTREQAHSVAYHVAGDIVSQSSVENSELHPLNQVLARAKDRCRTQGELISSTIVTEDRVMTNSNDASEAKDFCADLGMPSETQQGQPILTDGTTMSTATAVTPAEMKSCSTDSILQRDPLQQEVFLTDGMAVKNLNAAVSPDTKPLGSGTEPLAAIIPTSQS